MDTHVDQNSHKSLKLLRWITHSAVTPESSGRGLSHSTFFYLVATFYATTGCAAKMLLAITQLHPLQLEVAGKSLTLKCLASVVVAAAAGTIQG